ncbi:MAG: Rrf2 family transcriptional regulator [Gemmatimonadaceae bacterium]|jgi:Rrf2 family nitric oxide-sensitive transcriptional repressor|nr:Rrf2 family transcriptional regulator [Gemmatimonadaceae bacterium]
MHLTKFTDNALRCLIFLGATDARSSTVREIADHMGMSADHLTKVVQRLAALGLVETTRGVGGGVRLVREPDDIPLGRLVRETEQNFTLVECFDAATNQCPIAPVCALPPVLDEALEAFLAVLDRRSLADLLREPRRLRRAVGVTTS